MNPQTSKSQLTIGGLFCYTYIDRKEIWINFVSPWLDDKIGPL